MRHKRPKILFVSQQALGWITYSHEFQRILSERDDVVFHHLPVVPRMWSNALMFSPFIEPGKGLLRRLDPINAYQGFLGRHIRRTIARLRPDIVHFAGHYMAGAVAPLRDRPLVSSAMDATRPIMSLQRDIAEPTPASFAREQELLLQMDYIFPCSRWVENSLIDHYDINPGRIKQIALAINSDLIHPAASDTLSDKLQILMVANDFHRKGGERLVSWINGPLAGRCHLHIISSSDHARRAAGPDITAYGQVENTRLVTEILPQMDVLCHPTLADMSSFVIIEAAMAGVPAIASNIGGIGEIIQHGRTGWLVDPDDDAEFVKTLKNVVDSPQQLLRMRTQARAFAAEHFDSHTNYTALIDTLVELYRCEGRRNE